VVGLQPCGGQLTILPPSADEALSPLRAWIDDLARELASTDADGDGGVALKQRIFLLHRSVESHALVIASLQGDVKSLVDSWKERFQRGGEAADMQRLSGSFPAISAEPQSTRSTEDSRSDAPSAAATQPTEAAAEAHATAVPAPIEKAQEMVSAVVAPIAKPLGGAPVTGSPRVIDELNASTFVEKGWSRIATGNYSGAEESLQRALELNPSDPHAETLLGWAHMGQGKFDSAMVLFASVIERIPDHALAHVNAGYVHLRRHQHDPALDHLARAVALDSDRKATLYAHYYLGLVHFAKEEYSRAIAALQKAIELGPNLIEARFELGRVLWFAERPDDAKETWQKGAEVNKFNPWSARCRDMLATIADGGTPSRVA
jgi:tetratricopeptide (TPR) repeat protein